ncbi:MAG: ATP-binding cassette domain-containing protein [Lachnospiraceae bacterium]
MLLKINNLDVYYGKTHALHLTEPLTIEEGDRIGIIGSNGAGKSTLIKSLLGINHYQGFIESQVHPQEMAVHMQFNEYSESMSCRHVMEAILQTSVKKNKELQELINYFEFDPSLNKKYKSLSGGQKQRFTIILVMMQNARLTFYDEVTSGLDFETRQKLMEKLVEWYQNKNSSLCIVSHYYEELEQMADKLLILDQGKVVAFGQKEALFRKFCGRSIVALQNTPQNESLVHSYRHLAAPGHLIALSADNEEEEASIIRILVSQNINFKRSNSDIEMTFINAKAEYLKGETDNDQK